MGATMAEDPYMVLGVPRTASEDEVRRAYRKLAKELHPDLNPANRASAEERFKKVSAAYEIVGDAEKRKQFDRGEIDAAGEPRRGFHRTYAGGSGPSAGRAGGGGARPGGDDFSFGDIFSDLFGTMRGRGEAGSPFGVRGRDARYSLEVDFLEAATGGRKRVTLPDGGVLDIAVPAGVADGQVLRLKGKGSPGVRGAEPGDALVEIRVRPHQHFKRVDDDITLDLRSTRRSLAPRSRCRPFPGASSSRFPRPRVRAGPFA
jgi:DnaJ-class molecular chaperone